MTLLLVIPATIPLIQNLGIEIQRAQNRHQFRSIAYLAMAVLNFGISVVLCHLYGALGAPVGTAISLLLANGLIMNIYYHKKCNLDILSFWKEILRLSLGLLLPVAVGVVICVFGTGFNLGMQLLMMVVYTAVYGISMWLFGMNSYEKEIIRRFLKRPGRKKAKQ